MKSIALPITAFLTTLILCVGCGEKGPAQYEHWGTVTFQGRPVPAGEVRFDPDITSNDGPAGYATIKDGQYDTRLRPKSGPGAGKYRARIFAADGIEKPESPAGTPLFQTPVEIPFDLPAADGELNIVIPPGTH